MAKAVSSRAEYGPEVYNSIANTANAQLHQYVSTRLRQGADRSRFDLTRLTGFVLKEAIPSCEKEFRVRIGKEDKEAIANYVAFRYHKRNILGQKVEEEQFASALPTEPEEEEDEYGRRASQRFVGRQKILQQEKEERERELIERRQQEEEEKAKRELALAAAQEDDKKKRELAEAVAKLAQLSPGRVRPKPAHLQAGGSKTAASKSAATSAAPSAAASRRQSPVRGTQQQQQQLPQPQQPQQQQQRPQRSRSPSPSPPGSPTMAQQQQGPPAVTGSQINSLKPYDGTTDVRVYLRVVERIRLQYGWTKDQTLSVVKNKLEAAAAEWLMAHENTYGDIRKWDDFEDELKKRFKAEYTPAAAIAAMHAMKQKEGEPVLRYLDRVFAGLDIKNHLYPETLRSQPEYKQMLLTEAFQFFIGGLREEIKTRLQGSGNAPTDLDEARTMAVEIETALLQKKAPLALHEVAQQEEDEFSSHQVEELRKFIRRWDAKRGQGGSGAGGNKGKRKCYNCGKPGHFKAECRSAPKKKEGDSSKYKGGKKKVAEVEYEAEGEESSGEVSENE